MLIICLYTYNSIYALGEGRESKNRGFKLTFAMTILFTIGYHDHIFGAAVLKLKTVDYREIRTGIIRQRL